MPKPPTDPTHTLCPACGHRVVQAVTRDGRRIALNTGLRAYALVLNADNQTYRAETSRSYPVHACTGKKETL